MFSFLVINKQNLLHNLQEIKNICGGEVCAMVKANAYGHGLEQVVKILSGKVAAFGVVNIAEAMRVRAIDKKTSVIIFGICDNIKKAIENDITLTITSIEYLKKVVKVSKRCQKKPILHLNINSGMNRFGIKSKEDFDKILKILKQNKLCLNGIFTHFSSLTTDKNYTIKQKQIFDDFVSNLPQDFKPTVHVGGGNSIVQLNGYDMYRVGMFLYGYGLDRLKPVLSVQSQIVEIQNAKKGENIGYMCSFTAQKDMRLGIVPLGYADGVKRGLSNNLQVLVHGKKYNNVGKICMDCFMVEIDDGVKKGDSVLILNNATEWTEKLNTTEYEILTNFNFCRAKRITK